MDRQPVEIGKHKAARRLMEALRARCRGAAQGQEGGMIQQAALLWNRGLDTLAIALALGSTEAEIYNRLALIKRCAKDMRA
jgi:hypothetical protein